MKSKVCRNLIAIFCLVSLSVHSKSNLETERGFKIYKAKEYDVVEQGILVKISGDGNQSAIGQLRAVAVLDESFQQLHLFYKKNGKTVC